MIPKDKEAVLNFPINWNIIFKYDIIEGKVKPWLSKEFIKLMGADEPQINFNYYQKTF